MDIRKIKKLIELLEDSNLNEIEIKEGEESIRLSRGAVASAVAAPAPVAVAAAPPPEPSVVAGTETKVKDEQTLPDGHPVTSPMVGTFYSASKPGAEPFVQEGSSVQVGDTLCVLEAMKIFNPIEADRAGTVVAVLKQNGDPVEYGETLFILQ